MIRLIINADDLGSGPGRDRGILRAFGEGIVTSASLLANGPSFIEAARAARIEGLPVGVHLNLSEGLPVTGPIPGLTAPNGEFPGKTEVRRRLATRHVDTAAIGRELNGQVLKIIESGSVPDHLDTHQHIFLYPAITEPVLKTAETFGIPAVRLPCPAESADGDPRGSLGREMALYRRLSPAVRSAVRRATVATPDGLWGMSLLDRLNEKRLLSLFSGLPPGTWELMVHPGYSDSSPFGRAARERELTALLAPAVRSMVAERNIVLITFGDLACAS